MTARRLLVELSTNADLSNYGCVIMDEAHERTIDGDLCLGMIKEILRRREDLKLVSKFSALIFFFFEVF